MGLFDWLMPKGGAASAPKSVQDPVWPPPLTEEDLEMMHYPPTPKGLPVPTTTQILADQDKLMRDLREAIDCTNEDWADVGLPLVVRYADFVHLLPASQTHHHRTAGGLFRHGLEVAYHAARSSYHTLYAMDRPKRERDALQRRFRMAAMVAGLTHDLGKAASDMRVIDREGTLVWTPGVQTIYDWATSNHIDRYFIQWVEKRHRKHESFSAPLYLSAISTAPTYLWFTAQTPDIMETMLAAIAGQDRETAIGKCVAKGEESSVREDLRKHPIHLHSVSLGVPVEQYLVDAMKRLVAGCRWTINTPGSRLWMLPSGLHIVWPGGATDIVEVLLGDKVPALPRDPDVIADILIDHGIAAPQKQGRGCERMRYWQLAPLPLAKNGQPVTLTLLRLQNPAWILTLTPPTVPVIGAAPLVDPGDQSVDAPFDGSTPVEPGATLGEAPDPTPTGPKNPRASRPRAQSAPPKTEARKRSQPILQDEDPAPVEEATASPQRDDARRIALDSLHNAGNGGAILLQLVDDLIAGDVAPELVVRRGEHLCLRYPAIFADRKIEPIHYAEPLRDAGLLHLDRMAPNRLARELDGVHGLWLTAAASAWFIALAGDRWDSEEAAPAPAQSRPDNPGETPAATVDRLALAFVQAVSRGEIVAQPHPDGGWQVETDRVTRYARDHGQPARALFNALLYGRKCSVRGRYLLIPAE